MERSAFLKSVSLVPAVAAVPLRPIDNPAAPGPAYFTDPERAFVDAAVARLIPKDELGPGAKEAGVTHFIDRQLGGPYGRAETWYMQGPWRDGTQQQGYQLRLTPAQLYRKAIGEIDEHCGKTYGKRFADLDADTQDKLLRDMEGGVLQLSGVPAMRFFDILWQNTQSGFLADPMYGGNREFAGWKLIGFPGPRYNYVAEIEKHGVRYDMPTVGILGRDPGKRSA